jgi:hypothetical protein
MRYAFTIIMLVILFTFTGAGLRAQYFSTGQNPASVRWKQINTESFRVIFPEGYDSAANYVANTLEYAKSLSTLTLSADPPRTPVLIHNFTATSNGMVVWAPRRIELYTIPPQDGYAQEWFQQLAIHEYRHVIQISKLNQGLTNVLSKVFGEQLTGTVLGLYLPFWFLEGDAVAIETAHSNAGRGRQPSFEMPLRAQIMEKGKYSLDKALYGSYNDFTPNHYILGYHIVAKARSLYGWELWDKALDKVARKPILPNPFSRTIRRETGFWKAGLYRAMMDSLNQQWQKQYEIEDHSEISALKTKSKRVYTNYNRPHLTERGTIITEKKELDDIARFVEIDAEGAEEVLFTPGFYYPGTLSYANQRIVWAERTYDKRWHHRNYSVIKTYDLKTRKATTLTRNTRYFAPALSPDGSKIVAVEVAADQQYSLVILDAASGNLLSRISTPENDFFSRPAFSHDGKKIATIVLGDKGKAIAVADVETGEVETVSDFGFTDISKPAMHDDLIAFVGAWSGIDNLYLLDIESGEIHQAASFGYGITDPVFSPDGEKILFAHYTADGFEPAFIATDGLNLTPLSMVENHSPKLYEILAAQEGEILDPEKIPQENYEPDRYSKIGSLFNFHSWAPLSLDAQNYEAKPGISLFSQNLLSSSFTTLGWEWDINEETGKYYLNYSYAGWYPVLDVKADYGKRRSFFIDDNEDRTDFNWMETNLTAGLHVPFNFTSGKYSRFVRPAVEFQYTQLDIDQESGLEFRRSNYKTLNYRLNASNALKMSSHDIYPKWGQVFAFNLRTAPFENDTLGAMFSGETRLFFPGFIRHNSFNVYAGYQKRIENNFYYGNIVRFPRGYSGQYADELVSWSLNYAFPLGYPDLNAPGFAYLKRIWMNAFYDNATGRANNQTNYYRTAGVELYTDVHLFRILFPMTLGYRFIVISQQNKLMSEFLFSININAL